MLEGIEPKPEPVGDRLSAGWRGVASAWALVLLLALLFAGTQALASRRITASQAALVGAVIPRHDPASAVVGVPCAAPLDECGKVAPALMPEMSYSYQLW